jgi:hypothetical protein
MVQTLWTRVTLKMLHSQSETNQQNSDETCFIRTQKLHWNQWHKKARVLRPQVRFVSKLPAVLVWTMTPTSCHCASLLRGRRKLNFVPRIRYFHDTCFLGNWTTYALTDMVFATGVVTSTFVTLKKLSGFSQRENYTVRATAACRGS